MASKLQIDKLRNKLLRYDDAYHNGKEAIPDEEYDAYRDLLAKWSPNDSYFEKVGANTKASNKVKLPIPMPSLKKVRIGRGLEKWLEDHPGEIAVLDKLDGSSGMVIQKGERRNLYSRGNGTVGQNIVRLFPHIKGVPNKLPDISVRGELLISTSDWAKYKDDYDNPRALANSQVTATKSFHKAVKDITFVAHEIADPKLDWKRARIRLKSLGFIPAPTTFFKDPTPEQLALHLKERRDSSKYELDGLVLIHVRSGDRISFKVDAKPVAVVVDHVQWNISPNKLWKPKVILKTPISIGGVVVKQATGHNARYIIDHGIGPGAKIMIVRSGDVIPKVVGVVKRVKPQLPDSFKWDANKVEALADELSDDDANLVAAKRMVNAFSALEIPGVRLGLAKKLVEADMLSITDVLNATLEDLEDTGIGQANSRKLASELKRVKRSITHAKLMEASGLWPKGFTETKFTSILEVYPVKDLIAAYKSNKVKMIADIGRIHGLSAATAKIFIKSFAPYIRWVKDLDFRPKSSVTQVVLKTGKFTGREFVFTKIRDAAVQKYITDNGGAISGSVKKTTTDVIVKDKDSNSSKTDKAEAMGIRITALEDFKRQYKL